MIFSGSACIKSDCARRGLAWSILTKKTNPVGLKRTLWWVEHSVNALFTQRTVTSHWYWKYFVAVPTTTAERSFAYFRCCCEEQQNFLLLLFFFFSKTAIVWNLSFKLLNHENNGLSYFCLRKSISKWIRRSEWKKSENCSAAPKNGTKGNRENKANNHLIWKECERCGFTVSLSLLCFGGSESSVRAAVANTFSAINRIWQDILV